MKTLVYLRSKLLWLVLLVGCCITPTITLAQEGSGTEINVNNADIAAIVKIFSQRTKRNYIIDERVKGKVSIFLPGKVSSDEAIRVLDSVLSLKGFSSVPIGENLWKIVPAQEAKQTTIPTVDTIDGRGSPMMVTKLIRLKYISADDVQQLVSPLISSAGLANAYTGTNSIIMIDSEENIKRISTIIESIDLPFSDREMTIIPIEHANAQDIADKINDILTDSEEEGGNGAQSSSDLIRARLKETSRRLSTTGAQDGATLDGTSGTISARSRKPKIIADERTNSVIVVADEDTTLRIRALASQLDSEVNLSGSRFYVYQCQHAKAEELAEVLAGLISGEVNTRSDRPGIGDSTTRTQNRISDQQRTPGRSRSESRPQAGTTSVQFSEDLSITADAATNSLILSGSKSEYEKILSLLREIDVKRRQVLVEAMILEVSVDDSKSAGMEFLSSTGGDDGGILAVNNYGGLTQLLSDPTQLSQLSVAAASSGTLTLPGGVTIPTQTVLLSAASSNTNVNVLSSPTILATDNEEAEIVVGQNVPFLSSRSTNETNLNNTFNQIDRQDVGITLRLTPQINSENYVTMQLFTEVSSIIPATANSELGPATTIRTSQTTVVTKDSQMIVIGGLISDSQSESDQGVPFLKDIPVLGYAFRTKTDSQQKTNLLIFITPRIIKDQFDARDVTKTRSSRMESDITEMRSYPERRDVLESRNIDKVTEADLYEGPAPGTIIGERKKKKQAPVSRSRNFEPQPDAGSEALELEAAPAVPDTTDETAATHRSTEQTDSPRAMLGNQEATEPEISQYIVMQLQDSAPQGATLPFSLTDNKMFGVLMPGEPSQQARSFFVTGSYYTFNSEKGPVRTRVLGTFDSINETLEYYKELGSAAWYALTPHELLNLGAGPWELQ